MRGLSWRGRVRSGGTNPAKHSQLCILLGRPGTFVIVGRDAEEVKAVGAKLAGALTRKLQSIVLLGVQSANWSVACPRQVQKSNTVVYESPFGCSDGPPEFL